MAMEATGIKSYNTYINHFNELVKWKFFILIERSRNQHSSNVISFSAISKNNKAHNEALDKAFIKHMIKQDVKQHESTGESNCSIDKPINNKTIEWRKQEFATRIESYKNKYDIEMLREFYLYWSEHSDNGKKMRHEMQKVFNVERRLITWAKNQDKFDTPKQQGYTDERTENILRQIANMPKP